jgi:hypothetical protein
MPTKHHYGHWIADDGSYGYGDLLFIDPLDITPKFEARLAKLIEAEDFEAVFNLVKSKITTG